MSHIILCFSLCLCLCFSLCFSLCCDSSFDPLVRRPVIYPYCAPCDSIHLLCCTGSLSFKSHLELRWSFSSDECQPWRRNPSRACPNQGWYTLDCQTTRIDKLKVGPEGLTRENGGAGKCSGWGWDCYTRGWVCCGSKWDKARERWVCGGSEPHRQRISCRKWTGWYSKSHGYKSGSSWATLKEDRAKFVSFTAIEFDEEKDASRSNAEMCSAVEIMQRELLEQM